VTKKREGGKNEKLNGRRRELLGNWKPDCRTRTISRREPLSFPTRGSPETGYEAERDATGLFEH